MNGFHQPTPIVDAAYGQIRGAIRQARENAGLSQGELTRELGSPAGHIALIEAGQRRVDTLELYQIARALNVDPASLFRSIVERLRALEKISRDEPVGVRSAGDR